MIPGRLHHHLSLLLAPLFLLPLFAATYPLPLLPSPNPDLGPLLAFKLSLSRPAPPALSSWDPAADPCSSWRGVSCRGGHVARLVLVGLRLDGPIHHLAGLPRLALLSLNNNSFSSPLHRLDLSLSPWRAHLKHLHLSHNRFSGPFPASFLCLRHLRRLDLAGNLISGTIPPEIGLLLRRLLTLRLEENELGGAIPVSVGSIPGSPISTSLTTVCGEIPRQLSSFAPSSFAANPGLCGDSLLRRCLKNWTASCDRRPPPMVNGRKIRKWVAAIAGAISATIRLPPPSRWSPSCASSGGQRIEKWKLRRTGEKMGRRRKRRRREGGWSCLRGAGGLHWRT
ncbi:Leucine rich repeat N-terminal domain [Musa troglodytarum]|uniref:Leucine rich repeat N-terminal domain n=1 Tax=Musa troglodytarum TaxID=320322 RepID=A0A9E7FIU1_9LILI|nr:Leucine rich repeat N-terminal domain [Musa troglodytarum]